MDSFAMNLAEAITLLGVEILAFAVAAALSAPAAERPWSRYWDARSSREFAEALSAEIGIPISELIQSFKGGDVRLLGCILR
jgi:hypothetical protein